MQSIALDLWLALGFRRTPSLTMAFATLRAANCKALESYLLSKLSMATPSILHFLDVRNLGGLELLVWQRPSILVFRRLT